METSQSFESKLKTIAQKIQDHYHIKREIAIRVVMSMILAGLGANDDCHPLEAEVLSDEVDSYSSNISIIIDKIRDFLQAKRMPQVTKDFILSELGNAFTNKISGETKNETDGFKEIYCDVLQEIVPIAKKQNELLFDLSEILFAYTEMNDDTKNDIVLTPRYVADMMTELCLVNKNSHVLDITAGTGIFLLSSMRRMLDDIRSFGNERIIIEDIDYLRKSRLFGIEKDREMYLLALFNFILADINTENLFHGDALQILDANAMFDYYPFTALLLNQPYPAEENGFVFAEKAMSKMKSGRAAILVQTSAGTGSGLPYTSYILENNTLVACILMADIFKGQAVGSTSLYVFDVGIPHDVDRKVVFIDMTVDGDTRSTNRKTSSALKYKDPDNAYSHYQEAVDIVLGRKVKTGYYSEGREVFYDKITLNGNDWDVNLHRKSNIVPTIDDFQQIVKEYMQWSTEQMI